MLRWQYPKLGGVSPAEFIPFAEDGGLILPLGEWVLRCAVRQAKALIYKGFAPLIIAVNISTVKFRHTELPELVTRILAEEGLSDRNVPSAVIQKSESLLQSEIAKRKIG